MGLVAESPSAVSCCPAWAFWCALATVWGWKGREWSRALWVISEFLQAPSSLSLGASSWRAESQKPETRQRSIVMAEPSSSPARCAIQRFLGEKKKAAGPHTGRSRRIDADFSFLCLLRSSCQHRVALQSG